MTDFNPTPGGSGVGRTVPARDQNVIIDQAAANTAAQMAQQILANTNITLKQEHVKIPNFLGEKLKDTVTATQFITRSDECQVANEWNHNTTFANFSLVQGGGRRMAGLHLLAAQTYSRSENLDTDLPTVQKGIRRCFG
jgi:hypothetical protein